MVMAAFAGDGIHALAVVEDLDLSEAVMVSKQSDRDMCRASVDAVVDEVGDSGFQRVIRAEALDKSRVGGKLDPLDDVVRGRHHSTSSKSLLSNAEHLAVLTHRPGDAFGETSAVLAR